MTPQQFRDVRKRLGLSQAALGSALDLGTSTIELYERGSRRGSDSRPVEIPKTVRLALAALSLGITDYSGDDAS